MAIGAGIEATGTLSPKPAQAVTTGGAGEQSASSVISLPKGGGAIKGIGETFKPDLFTGTANLAVPIATSPGRGGFGPELTLQYSSGNGNGPFGLGWGLSIPLVSRKTEKGLPRYQDQHTLKCRVVRREDPTAPYCTDDDTFVLSGTEDLVERTDRGPRTEKVAWDTQALSFLVTSYRPRVEGLFARIERWQQTEITSPSILSGDFWRITTKDNVTNLYGRTPQAILADPTDSKKIFQWFLELTYDAKGNYIHYEYKAEDGLGVKQEPYEHNRERHQRYLKRIRYGNLTPFQPSVSGAAERLLTTPASPSSPDQDCFFLIVFDYGEHGQLDDATKIPTITRDIHQETRPWTPRPDPFSTYRAGFEIRTHRLCQRVLMLHAKMPEESSPVLVKSTDFLYRNDPHTKLSFLQGVTQRGYKKAAQAGTYESEELTLHLGEPGVRSSVYEIKSIPRLDFGYTEFKPDQQRFQSFSAEDGDLPARSLADPNVALVDLFGTGLPDILQTTPTAYYFWRNLGNGRLARRNVLENAPAGITLDQDGIGFGDMAGDGKADLLVHRGNVWGFCEATNDGGWQPIRYYKHVPSIHINDANVRLVDLTGDGTADILYAADRYFAWFPCLGEKGFDDPRLTSRRHNLEEFPDVFFADPRVRLADMTGDGLQDIVFLHSGRIDYWPNLGYGRFGKRVTMANPPTLGPRVDPKRLFLADLDGSGPADLIYVESDRLRFWLNQSGNSWSREQPIRSTPHVIDVDSLELADLFGTGTQVLLYSTDYRGAGRSNYWFLDLIGGMKPYILTETTNNLGATTHAQYGTSTQEYLADLKEGHKWRTSLPFPVRILKKVEVIDHISKSKLVTTYRYHHGYYDGREREFRGFGRVDHVDTEQFEIYNGPGLHGTEADFKRTEASAHIPPILTKTWFHTGLYLGREHVSDYFAGLQNATDHGEYFREPGLTNAEARALLLPDTVLPEGLTVDEEEAACRALKGSMLRQEVYADDAGPGATPKQVQRARMPYTVTEQNLTIRRVQPRGGNRHAVFVTHAREVISYHYERSPADPRIQHAMTLEVDDFGNVLKEAAIGYGRRKQLRVVDDRGQVQYVSNPGLTTLDPTDQAKQTTTLLTYTENRFTNAIETLDTYRSQLLCEAVTFELTGYTPTGAAGRFQASDLVEPDHVATGRLRHKFTSHVPYEAAGTRNLCRRPIEWVRTLYRRDDLSGLLPLGDLQPLALPGESYKLAFTPGLLAQVFQRPRQAQVAEPLLPDPAAVLSGQTGNQGGYLQSQVLKSDSRFPATDADDHWWIPSGRSFFTSNSSDSPAAELAQAQQHFFLPRRHRDPFGYDSFVDFDTYDLLIAETRDALGNRVTVEVNDYRVLQPRLVRDPNRNRTEVAFDTLGMVVSTAIMGKPLPAPPEGDSLSGFGPDLTQAQIDGCLDATDPHVTAAALLKDATTCFVYDLNRFRRTRQANPSEPTKWQPACAATLARETHVNDLRPGLKSKIQISFTYSDGFGREVQKKIQAEPGPVPQRDAAGKIISGVDDQPVLTLNNVSPRWVGSGWTMFNNKGKPVRQFEPFFTDTHRFEFDVRIGVSPVLFYDPAERVIATLHPNHTYEKVVFDPWQQTTFDVNDTCAPRNAQTGDPWTDLDMTGYFKALPANPSQSRQTWHAQRIDGALGQEESNAALRAAAHADTPTTAHFDALGRSFLTVARNRVICSGHDLDGTEDIFATRVELDIEGNQREVRDERKLPVNHLPNGAVEQRIVMRYAYDLLGNRLHQRSMEAGARWMMNDVAGKPIRVWDSRGHNLTTKYDALRRPVEQYVRGTFSDADPLKPNSDPRTLNRDILVDRIEYGESIANAEALNLRTRIYRHFDSAGIATNARLDASGDPTEAYDFKGNLLHSSRQLVSDYKIIPDWLLNPHLDTETFEGSTRYDALNRPIQSVAPHSSLTRRAHPNKFNVTRPVYNEANLLERVNVWLERAAWPSGLLDPASEAPSPIGVTDIDYDAKGQRMRIDYKNGASTFYSYDPLTFRLTQLLTKRKAVDFPGDDPQPPISDWPGKQMQNQHYTYDPAGNITHIRDDAQQTIYFKNRRVEPSNDYIYDAVYRLIQAHGREHLGQVGGAPISHSHHNGGRVGLVSADAAGRFASNDGNAMARYCETYFYDSVGNFLAMTHHDTCSSAASWSRRYNYLESSLIEDGSDGAPRKVSNRLSHTMLNPAGNTRHPEIHQHDAHGNMTKMSHLPLVHWDYRDQLQATSRQVVHNSGTPEITYYVYDASGQRMRKVTERQAPAGQTPTRMRERIYLGAIEFHREFDNSGTNLTLERETLHVMDDKQRMALVETRTLDVASNDQAPRQLIRYQLANHLGSTSLELDEHAQIISYEEYAPYGNSTYQAMRGQTETAKRYRYTGKERDDESGLYYHGARYYAPWLGRWTSCDPTGTINGLNLFEALRENPITFKDLTGLESVGGFVERKAMQSIKEGRHISGYLWSFADVAWSVFGAEGMSKVASGDASTGDYVSAGIEAVSVIPIGKLAKGAKGVLAAKSGVKEAVPVATKEIVEEVAPIAAKETIEKATSYAGKTAAEKDKLFKAAKEALKANQQSKLSPISATTLGSVGKVSSQSGFRQAVARVISKDKDHPLKFLIGPQGNLHSGAGKGANVWAEFPEMVEAGHAVSKKALEGATKGGDRFMVMSVWHNRMISGTIEHSAKGGHMALDYAVEIGGIPVHAATAYDWVAKGLLDPQLLATARKVIF